MTRRLLSGLVLGLFLVPAGLRAQAPVRESHFDSDGVRIRYVVQGKDDGEPVLLIHGFSANVELQWAAVLPALVKDYKVIALDCRGHGGSGKPHDPRQYGLAMTRDAIRLLDHLKIDKAHVVGYSMGATITLQIAARYPERVRTATLGGAGLPLPGFDKLLGELADSLEQGKGFGPIILALTPKDRPRPTELQILATNAALLGWNDARALAAVVRGGINGKDSELSEEQIKGIKVPMLALIGEADPLRAGVDELKKRLPELKVVVIDKADHMTTFIRGEFITALKGFLDAQRKKVDLSPRPPARHDTACRLSGRRRSSFAWGSFTAFVACRRYAISRSMTRTDRAEACEANRQRGWGNVADMGSLLCV